MPPWKKVKLGDVCSEITYGYTESANWQPVGPKFLRITDIQLDHINWDTVPFCKISDSDHTKYKLEKGDIVIARTGNSTGAISTIKDNIDAVFASYLIRYRTIKSIANPFFVDFVMRSNKWKDFVNNIKGGSAQPGANAKQFGEFEFDLPDIDTQSRIASILSAFDDKIELNRQMNNTLEQMAQALFKKYFVTGIDPDNLPEGWRWGKISDLYSTTSGGTPSRKKLNYYEDKKYFWVKSKELNSSFVLETEEMISEEGYKNSSAKLLPKYSILLAMYGNTTGEYGILGIEATCNQAVCAILPNENYPFTFIYQIIKNAQTDLINRAVGSAQQNISQDVIQDFEILIPEMAVVKKYHNEVFSIFGKIESNLKEIKILSNIRDSLLPKLMNGELSVDSVSLEESQKTIVA